MAVSALSHMHVIEPNARRRAAIFKQLHSCSIHAEIYENVAEFIAAAPSKGAILANDDVAEGPARALIEKLKSSCLFLPLAMYSENPSPNKVVNAVSSGALDYLGWPFDAAQLEQTCERLAKSENVGREQSRKAEARALIARLSAREREVLQHLLAGGTNKSLARAMEISPRTVELHRSHMMRKLGANSTAEAVRIGLLADLLD